MAKRICRQSGTICRRSEGKKICECEYNLIHLWLKLRVAVAWLLTVKDTLKCLVQKRKNSRKTQEDNISRQKINRMKTISVNPNTVTVEDLKKAENAIISYVQRQTFPDKISTLQEGRSSLKKGGSSYRLDLVLDDGVPRVGGRLRKTLMPEETKHPLILAKDHHVSTLILCHIHI